MEKTKPRLIVVIPFHLPWDWPADFLRQTASELAKDHVVVCFLSVEHVRLRDLLGGIWRHPVLRRADHGAWLFRPVFLIPFERFLLFRRMNYWVNLLMLQLVLLVLHPGAGARVFWVFDRSQEFLRRVLMPWYKTLYDCVDYVWHPDPTTCRIYREEESRLIRAADVMTVNSETLYMLHKDHRPDAAIVPLGVRLPVKPVSLGRRASGRRPRVGYIGVIDYRMDFPLLLELVSIHPEWDFVIWGAVQRVVPFGMPAIDRWVARLKRFPNVVTGSSRRAPDVYQVIRRFDVCIIPYNSALDIVKYSFPMKVFEYFFAGKPVVSADIQELRRYTPYVRIGHTTGEWGAHIRAALTRSISSRVNRKEISIAAAHSWERKIRASVGLIGGLLRV